MTSPRHLSWENFQGTILLRGEQRVHRVMDTPLLEIFGDGIANRIGMWIEVPSETVVPADLSSLAAIRTELIERDRRMHLGCPPPPGRCRSSSITSQLRLQSGSQSKRDLR